MSSRAWSPVLSPSLLVGRPAAVQGQLVEVFAEAWATGVLAPERLRTGCLYDPQGHSARGYFLAPMRFDPRGSGRRQIPIHAWRPELAPSAGLLRAYRHTDAHGQRQVQWPEFARAYLTEIEALPTAFLIAFVTALGDLPWHYRVVTLLCCEHAPGGDEALVRCHRRLLRAWLLGEEVPDVPRV